MGGARIGEAGRNVTPLCAAGFPAPDCQAESGSASPPAVATPREASLALLSSTPARLAILLAVALALRGYTFGDPNLFIDEAFYFAAGNAMHQGALPYVDIWDRKPFGLFLIYYLIAALSADPAAYQVAAALFAVLTAWIIGRIADLWSKGAGGLLAGIGYLFLLSAFQGFGGQSPVFYNLFIALAAWLVARSLPHLREGQVPRGVVIAMLSAGFAITIKTTAFFEAAFLGLFVLLALPAAERLRHAPRLALLGATPALLIALGYAQAGHWSEYWQAMTGANLSADRWEPYSAQIRFRLMLAALAPLLALAAFGWLDLKGEARRFVGLWVLAALIGLAAFPYFHLHYALPLLVPLCVAAGAFLSRRWIGPAAAAGLCLFAFTRSPPIDPAHTARSQVAMAELADLIASHDANRGLLVYEGPPFLYTLTGQPFPSPLAFPAHLYHGIEKDVSHLITLDEVNRILARRPGVIVMTREPRDGPINAETHAAVQAHVEAHCRLVGEVTAPERLRADQVLVWGDCR